MRRVQCPKSVAIIRLNLGSRDPIAFVRAMRPLVDHPQPLNDALVLKIVRVADLESQPTEDLLAPAVGLVRVGDEATRSMLLHSPRHDHLGGTSCEATAAKRRVQPVAQFNHFLPMGSASPLESRPPFAYNSAALVVVASRTQV
ncbi:hypothetical protein ACCO45_010943 [Purpureocillium lilacinum]|uniref:Uncharacterized protein n=1 Tax=Purpureocillium lilacinum TaxID=33203 RepID=A0ACC4DG60_PURLI